MIQNNVKLGINIRKDKQTYLTNNGMYNANAEAVAIS
jgi:hypothetical protein